MKQENLVRLYFEKNTKNANLEYCFNAECPLSKGCVHQLAVAFKDADETSGRSIFPDAMQNGECAHFQQLQLVKTAWGFNSILPELKKKDEAEFRSLLTYYFGSSTSYYRYKLGQSPITPCQQRYILGYLREKGYAGLDFDCYTEEVDFIRK